MTAIERSGVRTQASKPKASTKKKTPRRKVAAK
jgi:hypothetical protein